MIDQQTKQKKQNCNDGFCQRTISGSGPSGEGYTSVSNAGGFKEMADGSHFASLAIALSASAESWILRHRLA